jgi:hypothetical protein
MVVGNDSVADDVIDVTVEDSSGVVGVAVGNDSADVEMVVDGRCTDGGSGGVGATGPTVVPVPTVTGTTVPTLAGTTPTAGGTTGESYA